MSLVQFQDDTKAWINRLFVINHSHKGDFVELFDYSPESNSLTFVKRIESSLFVTPKDIVAVDQDRFYLTNQHVWSTYFIIIHLWMHEITIAYMAKANVPFVLLTKQGMAIKYGRVVEDLAGLALGSVVYYNGKESFKVLESLANPYGNDFFFCSFLFHDPIFFLLFVNNHAPLFSTLQRY